MKTKLVETVVYSCQYGIDNDLNSYGDYDTLECAVQRVTLLVDASNVPVCPPLPKNEAVAAPSGESVENTGRRIWYLTGYKGGQKIYKVLTVAQVAAALEALFYQQALASASRRVWDTVVVEDEEKS